MGHNGERQTEEKCIQGYGGEISMKETAWKT